MKYKEYLKVKYLEEDSPSGDLARDVMQDVNFPSTNEEGDIRKYLFSMNACPEALATFQHTFTEYRNFVSGGEAYGRTYDLYKVRSKYR